MELRINEVIKLVEGATKQEADESLKIHHISPIDEAKEGSLSFLYNSKYNHYLYSTKASAVMVSKDFVPENNKHPYLIFVDDVYTRLISLLERFNHVNANKKGIEEPVFIGSKAEIGEGVYLGAFSYIGAGAKIGKGVKIYPNCYIGEDAVIDDNSILYAGVKVYNRCKVGKDCILHSGVVIGSDGFGHAPQSDGTYKKIPQIGNVVLKDRVEIGANTTIDRATIESTIIQQGVKLDNLIQIAHNVEIGENTVIAAQSGISGSTKIGKQCIIAGQVGFVGHIEIADGAQFGAKSGISKSIKEKNSKWFGVPLMPVNETLRLHILLKKFPEIYKQFRLMENEIKQLKDSGKQD